MDVCLPFLAFAGTCFGGNDGPGRARHRRSDRDLPQRGQSTCQRGTVLGGLAGGVIGHQIGSGRGNTAATIAGAVGGAVVGTEIEKKHVQGSRYRITVRLDSGSTLIVEDTRDVNLRVGDRVRVDNNRIYRV